MFPKISVVGGNSGLMKNSNNIGNLTGGLTGGGIYSGSVRNSLAK